MELAKHYENKEWNFREEAIKYCHLDCKSLFEVLTKFNELLFNQFQVNVHKPLTLPALAMRIYKTHFMPENTIHKLSGEVERDIPTAYGENLTPPVGGAVDVYTPHNLDFVTGKAQPLYYYDYNSLFPSCMGREKFCVGKPISFEGNIRLIEPGARGFFYCNIDCPLYINKPILQRRIKTSEGTRTIAGVGSWTGWVSSIEMDNALKYGYKFEILKGYKFEEQVIFKGYVETMYDLRLKYPKSDPMNFNAKLLMNSLYGRFGMHSNQAIVEIFNTQLENDQRALKDILDKYGEFIQDQITIDNFELIMRPSNNYDRDDSFDTFHSPDVNISIASDIPGLVEIRVRYLK